MANTRQQSIRLQQARKSSNRVSSQPRKQIKQSFISRSRYLTGEANKQIAMDNVIKKLNATNNINEQISILDSAPLTIRANVQQIRTQLLTSHNNTIAKLEVNLKSDIANADKSRYRERRANNEHEEQRYNQEIDRFDAKVSALKTIISDMKAGKSYDYNSVNSYVYNVGFAAMRGQRASFEAQQALENAQQLAEYKTTQQITQAGLVNVMDRSGKLIGYETNEKNPTQYRFDRFGNAKFYSGYKIKPITTNGKITGYIDTATQQSVALRDIDRHITNERVIVTPSSEQESTLSKLGLEKSWGRERTYKPSLIYNKLSVLQGKVPAEKLKQQIKKMLGGEPEESKSKAESLYRTYRAFSIYGPGKIMTMDKYDKALFYSYFKGLNNATIGYAVLMQLIFTKELRRNVLEKGLEVGAMVISPEGRRIILNGAKAYIALGLRKDLERIGKNAFKRPEVAVGNAYAFATDIYLGMKIGKAVSTFSKKVARSVLNSNPRLLRVIDDKIVVNSKLVLRVGGVKEGAESLSTQLARGGTKVSALSAQSRKLVGLIKRKKIIRKPLPEGAEAQLSKVAKAQLKKFDKGQLTTPQIINLNKLLRKETKALGTQPLGIDLLERSTYFDTDRLLRTSRLALQKSDVDGSFIDLLRGRASLFKKRLKPQVLSLESYVEAVPKTKEFKSIIAKLERANALGKKANLTKNELAILSTFQVTPSGLLKPIGSTTWAGGIEREVTVSAKDAVKRIKKLGTVIIDGERIPIIAVKIVKGKENVKIVVKVMKLVDKIKALKKKLTKTKSVKLKKKLLADIKKLENEIAGVNVKISKSKASKEIRSFLRGRRSTVSKKVFPVGRRTTERALQVGSRVVRRTTTKRRTPTKRSPARTPRTPTRTRPRATVKRTPRTPTRTRPRVTVRAKPRTPTRGKPRSPVRRPPRTPTRSKPKKPVRGSTKKTVKKTSGRSNKEVGYQSYVYRKKVNTKRTLPITKARALDLLAYHLDKNTSVKGLTIKGIRRVSPAVLNRRLKSTPKNYFVKNRNKFILRKLTRGKETYEMIEKKKFRRDSKVEKRRKKR